jgi:hypothetical protein
VAEPYAGKGTQDGVPGPMLKLDMTKAFWGVYDTLQYCEMMPLCCILLLQLARSLQLTHSTHFLVRCMNTHYSLFSPKLSF